MKPTQSDTVSKKTTKRTNGNTPGTALSGPTGGKALERKSAGEPTGTPEVVYASDAAQLEWELGDAIEALEAEMPKEAEPLRMKAIAFNEEHEARGLQAIFDIGRVEAAQGEWLLVPERTLFFLDKLGIPYREAPASA